MDLNVVILAAGKGTRMRSTLPKVLQPLAKKPLLSHVLEVSYALKATNVVVVYGHGGKAVQSTVEKLHSEHSIAWVEQEEQLGTGHAVKVALPELAASTQTLILYGDVPLVTEQTLRAFIDSTDKEGCGLLTVTLDNPTGYGRIIRSAEGQVEAIVEEKDATELQKQVREVNTGIMLVNTALLQKWLPALGNSNSQGEYYLTDIAKMARDEHITVQATIVADPVEVEGVNDKVQLSQLERRYQQKQAENLMLNGAIVAEIGRAHV